MQTFHSQLQEEFSYERVKEIAASYLFEGIVFTEWKVIDDPYAELE